MLGEGKEAGNKRNGYTKRSFAIKGIGEVSLKVPRDRKGAFESKIIPPSRRGVEARATDGVRVARRVPVTGRASESARASRRARPR